MLIRESIGAVKLRRVLSIVLWIALLVWTAHVVSTQHGQMSHSQDDAPEKSQKATDSQYELGALPNITTSDKVAVIVETRTAGNLVPLILHFAGVLGPTWPILVYTDTQMTGSFSMSASLNRMQEMGRVVLRPLPQGMSFPSWDSVSNFMVKRWLWDDLAPAEHILMFQSDSILCANAARSVDDFLEYDLIGAPIKENYGRGYNGGLSLRRRSTTLRFLDLGLSRDKAEDQWYYQRLVRDSVFKSMLMTNRFKELMDEDEANGVQDGVKLPPVEIARTFAVETIDYPHPLGEF